MFIRCGMRRQNRSAGRAVVWGGGVDHDVGMTRLLLEAGWPMDVRGGDIDGSALNGAVFRGDAELTAFLMAHGGGLRVPHGVWR